MADCFGLIFIPTNPLITNGNINDEAEFCATDALHLNRLKADTVYSNQHFQFEKEILQQLSSNSIGSFQRAAGPYVLPIVIHIIHNNGSENLTDNDVLQGVQNLNDAFSNIDYYDPNTGVDTKINFCLAKSDPNGNATNGINRIVSPVTNMDANNDDLTVKDLSRWNPLSYINIWLVKEIRRGASTGVAGYAYFPSAHGRDFDGIMMEARWFASSQGASGVQIHEMGHYLGLYHTFQGGCANNNCLTQGDRVCDTPPDQSTVRVPCNGDPNSCSSDVNLSDPNNPFTSDQIDMFWNYMDYGDFDCYSAFTAGQSERMCAAIEVTRSSLLSSTACEDPCLSPVTASFNIPSTTVAAGTNVNFINTSTNGNTYSWTIDGVEFSTAMNPSFTFNQLGEFTVTLSVIGGENCRGFVKLEIEVICPILNSFEADNLFLIKEGQLLLLIIQVAGLILNGL